MDEDTYRLHGFKNRAEYLQSLAEEYGLDYEMICAFANLLGPNEDFDGLINALEDATADFDESLLDDFDDDDDDFYGYLYNYDIGEDDDDDEDDEF